MSKAKEIFEKIGTDPKVMELIKGKEKPKTKEESIAVYIDIAKQLGYDLTSEDVIAFFDEKAEEIKNGTESSAKAVQALSDDAIAEAAGGACGYAQICGEPYYFYCSGNYWKY